MYVARASAMRSRLLLPGFLPRFHEGLLVRASHTKRKVVRPLVVCGPSGVGKTTLIKRVINTNPDLFGFSVSHTTRKPRPGEKRGVDYHFVSEQEMRDAMSRGEFLEHAEVHGNLYGTSVSAVKALHKLEKICVLDIDMQGVHSFKAHPAHDELRPLFLFIAPPAMQTLRQRLQHRATDTDDNIERRLQKATEEVNYGKTEGNFDAVIVNNELEQAEKELHSLLEKWFPQYVRHK